MCLACRGRLSSVVLPKPPEGGIGFWAPDPQEGHAGVTPGADAVADLLTQGQIPFHFEPFLGGVTNSVFFYGENINFFKGFKRFFLILHTGFLEEIFNFFFWRLQKFAGNRCLGVTFRFYES